MEFPGTVALGDSPLKRKSQGRIVRGVFYHESFEFIECGGSVFICNYSGRSSLQGNVPHLARKVWLRGFQRFGLIITTYYSGRSSLQGNVPHLARKVWLRGFQRFGLIITTYFGFPFSRIHTPSTNVRCIHFRLQRLPYPSLARLDAFFSRRKSVPIGPWASAHRPMGARPPPHGRSPTAPWARAHRPVGAD